MKKRERRKRNKTKKSFWQRLWMTQCRVVFGKKWSKSDNTVGRVYWRDRVTRI